MTEQLGFAARSPADGALKLSSAVIAADGSDHLLPSELRPKRRIRHQEK
ncbi:hypothetical protein [Amycolatopsis sp. NPDC051371]